MDISKLIVFGAIPLQLLALDCLPLSTNQGLKISDDQNSLKAGERGPTLLEDFILREKITHFDHERIPERAVHARGSAAHGIFEVYESMSPFTKAKFLENPSEKIPVFVRFSTVAGSKGSADTIRDARGFATKFYTKEGVFDLVGNNIPVFFIQDGIKFPDLIHAVKPEPHNEIPQASSAHDNFWDFISLTPESMHMIMWVMSDRALPRSYSNMEGFGVHTFRFVNAEGVSHFVKFHWKPLKGIYSLMFEEAQIIAGKDPDFNRRDLYDSIEKGDFPEYELGVQMITEQDAQKLPFDILDPTKLWPEEDIPVKLIGKMTLNRNPDNFFNETEQVAFHPGHIVPGIDFSDDPLLQVRLFSYLDTQLLRLGGPNFHEIPINKSVAEVSNNQRGGLSRHAKDAGKVNYGPNSLAGGCPMQTAIKDGGFATFPTLVTGEKIRKRPESFGDHYSQAALFWNSMSDPEKLHIVKAFCFELGKVNFIHIRKKMVEHLNHINHVLAKEVALGIDLEPPAELEGAITSKKSPLLSMDNHRVDSIKGRKIALLEGRGDNIEALKNKLIQEGAIVDVISTKLGKPADKTYAMASSVFYDAVIIPEGVENEDAKVFAQEAYRHNKPIIVFGTSKELLSDKKNKDGIIDGKDFEQIKKGVAAHRFWSREK